MSVDVGYAPLTVSSDVHYCVPLDSIEDPINNESGPDIMCIALQAIFDGPDVVKPLEHVINNQGQPDQDIAIQEEFPALHCIPSSELNASCQYNQQYDKDSQINHPTNSGTLTDKNAYPDFDVAIKHNALGAVVTRDQSMQTEKKLYECDICGKTYTYPKCLRIHKAKHTQSSLFACSSSGRRFNDAALGRYIKDTQTEKTPCEYAICSKTFINRDCLSIHRSKDTRKKLFDCSYCGKQFNHQANCKRHMNIHTRKRTYECGICPKKFLQKGNLIRHEQRHREEKVYVCTTCSKSFVTKWELDVHKARRRKTGQRCVS